MMKYLVTLLLILLSIPSTAQIAYVTIHNNPTPGYLFLTPLEEVGKIACYDNALFKPYESVYSTDIQQLFDLKMLDDGRFVAFVHPIGVWYLFNNDFQIIDTIPQPGRYYTDFHDIQFNSNNEYFLFTERMDTVDMSVLVPGGKQKALVRNMMIYGFNSNDEEIFQWDALDHLEITDATEDVDLTRNVINPFHFNSIDFDAQGNLIISARHLDAVIKIDKTNGNILWIMGGSKSKINEFTFVNDTRDNFFGFSHQHQVVYLANGNIMMFDNGNLKPQAESRAVEYQIDEANMTATKVFEYYHSPAVFSGSMGSVQRFSNGNTLIGWGGNGGGDHNIVCSEVTAEGGTAFEIEGSVGIYRAWKFPYKIDFYENNVTSTGNYNFNGGGYTTGVNLNVQNLNGSGKITVEKHRYQPHNIEFDGTSACDILPYRWILMTDDIDSLRGQIKIATSSIGNPQDPANATIYFRPNENSGIFIPLETSYNQSGSYIYANIHSAGEYFVSLNIYPKVALDYPANNQIAVSINPLLKWNRVQSGELYDLQIATDQNFNNIVMTISGHSDNQIVVDGLQYATRYYWRVKAFKETCGSEWSSSWCFNTTLAAPVLTLPADGSKEQKVDLKFSWGNVQGASKYRFQLSKDITFINNIRDFEIQNSIDIQVNNLENNTIYYWRVAAYDQVYSAWSSIFSFKTVISKPELSYPLNNAAGIKLSPKLIWNQVIGADFYNVLVSSDEQFREIVQDIPGIKNNEVVLADLKPLKNYYWRVKAVNDGSMSDWSEVRKFFTTMQNPVLVSPANLEEKINTSGFLIWQSIPEAVKYEIQLSMDSSFVIGTITNSSTKNLFSYSSLTKSGKYYWKVKAINNDGESDWSERFSFITAGDMDILPPDLTQPINESSRNDLTIELRWNRSVDGAVYEVEMSDRIDFSNIIFKDIDVSESMKIVEQLNYNKKYYWRIRSMKDDKQSSWSEVWSFTTKLRSSSLISPFQNEENVSGEAKFIWSSSDGAVYYNFEIATDFNFLDVIVLKDNLLDTTYQADVLEPGRTYYWRVRPWSEVNSGDWSVTGEFKTTSASEIKGEDVRMNLFAYPNPTFGIITLDIYFDIAGKYEINIINSDGNRKKIEACGLSEKAVSLDVSQYPAGKYIIEIVTEDRIQFARFIKI